MTNFLYTKTVGGFWNEGRVDCQEEELIGRIENAEVFHMPLGKCIKIEDTFIHSILLNGRRWDANTKEWQVVPKGKVLKLKTPTSHALLATGTRGKETVLVLLAVTLLIEIATIVYFLLK